MNWEPYRLATLAHAFGAPVMSAVLRAEPEDFQVDEQLGFVPSGDGEHVLLLIRKRNQNTAWIADQLARLAGVKPMDVAYSGLKDRRAVTTQWFSIYWNKAELPDLSALWNDDIQLLAQTRNNRKLRRGAHQGNRFVITLRDVEGEREAIEARLQLIASQGVPNYFGEQRFGINGGNLEAGEQLLQERLADPRRRRKEDRREALYLSALRSALFNRLLSARITACSWNRQVPGDVLNLDGRGSFFVPKPEDTGLDERVAVLELHPTGPLHGRGLPVVSGEVLALETALAAEAGGVVAGLTALGLEAQRRALRLATRDMAWSWPDASSLQLHFTLTSGSFATAVLRELSLLRDSAPDAVPVE
jgi:tRNA pseudouridine13 synthase